MLLPQIRKVLYIRKESTNLRNAVCLFCFSLVPEPFHVFISNVDEEMGKGLTSFVDDIELVVGF